MDSHFLDNFIKEYQYESDRAACLLLTAYLEERLARLIRKFLVNDERFIAECVMGDGPGVVLDTFVKKMNFAFALGLLRVKELQDLQLIRKVQRAFLFGPAGLTFDDDEIKGKCFDLAMAKDVISSSSHQGRFKDNARSRFIIAAGLLGHYLAYRAEHETRHRDVFPSYDSLK